MTVEHGAPGVGRHPPGRRPVPSCRATPATIRTPPPLLGEDTDEILAELGRTPAQIAAPAGGLTVADRRCV